MHNQQKTRNKVTQQKEIDCPSSQSTIMLAVYVTYNPSQIPWNTTFELVISYNVAHGHINRVQRKPF